MASTSVRIGALLVHAPVNAGTSLFLTLQGGAYFARLRREGGERTRYWALFFLMMALATSAGVVKHGIPDLLGVRAMIGVLAVSNVGSGLSTWFAQKATLRSRAGAGLRPALERLVAVQLLAYLAANALLGPRIELLIANTVVGLVPVIVAEGAARSGPPGGSIALGISLSLLTGAVYLWGVSPSPWFNHIDLAHLVMGLSLYLIQRGVHRGAAAGTRSLRPGSTRG